MLRRSSWLGRLPSDERPDCGVRASRTSTVERGVGAPAGAQSRPPPDAVPHLHLPHVSEMLRRVKKTVTQLTDALIASYARVGGINHLDGVNLPSKSGIAQITCELLRLLF